MRVTNGFLYEVKESDIQNGHFTVPKDVRAIGDFAFWNRKELKSVTFPEGLDTIGNMAFQGCKNLESVEIPASVTGIGCRAFKECEKLKNVSFVAGSNLALINSEAFQGCWNLTRITIPDNVKVIGDDAFSGCYELSECSVCANTEIGHHCFDLCPEVQLICRPEKHIVLDTRIHNAAAKKKPAWQDMSDEELHQELCTKLSREHAEYYNKLLTLSPTDILLNAHEYITKSDILTRVLNNEFPREQTKTLLKAEKPLDKIYAAYSHYEANHMENIGLAIDRATRTIAARGFSKQENQHSK